MTQNNVVTYIAFGANLSNPKSTFNAALTDLKISGIEPLATSSLWRSPAWPPGSDAPDYLNAVISVNYSGKPMDLLQSLQSIEQNHGRLRSVRNTPRTLDLDILDFKQAVIHSPDLTIPHPRMLSRAFVLFPLAELAPNWTDPSSGQSIDYFIGQLSEEDAKNTVPTERDWATP